MGGLPQGTRHNFQLASSTRQIRNVAIQANHSSRLTRKGGSIMPRHRLQAVADRFASGGCLAWLPPRQTRRGCLGVRRGRNSSAIPSLSTTPYYLPNQQMQALRPTPMDSVNQAMMSRQYFAQNDRTALTNPISPYADRDTTRFGLTQNKGKSGLHGPSVFAADPRNADGAGPSLYFNRTGKYHPKLRTGRGPNANVSATALGRASRYTWALAEAGVVAWVVWVAA